MGGIQEPINCLDSPSLCSCSLLRPHLLPLWPIHSLGLRTGKMPQPWSTPPSLATCLASKSKLALSLNRLVALGR